MNNRILHISAFAALAILSSACQLRPLEDPSAEMELDVKVELKTILNVNTEIYNKNITPPKVNTDMIRVLFFNPTTHELVTQAFLSDSKGEGTENPCICGTINIEPGTYDMICYNFDTPDTFIRGENNLPDLESYTANVSASIKAQFAPSLPEGTAIYYEPDHVVLAREMGIEIKPHTGTLTIETNASTVVDSYYIQVHATGLKYATNMSAVITGMTPSYKLGIDEPQTANPCAVWFQILPSQDEKYVGGNQDVFCATFSTFGKIYHMKDEESKADDDLFFPEDSKLVITFNSSGSTETQVYTYDMNELFMTEDALERHWLIINDTIAVPEPTPGGGGGGFTPIVDEWEDEKGEILI